MPHTFSLVNDSDNVCVVVDQFDAVGNNPFHPQAVSGHSNVLHHWLCGDVHCQGCSWGGDDS